MANPSRHHRTTAKRFSSTSFIRLKFRGRMSIFQVDCDELPRWTAAAAWPANLGRRRGLSATELRRIAGDFGKLQVFAAHFGQDCGELWQGKSLYFKGNRCSRLWKLTGKIRSGDQAKTANDSDKLCLAMHVQFREYSLCVRSNGRMGKT
jgi:hypothetical protein